MLEVDCKGRDLMTEKINLDQKFAPFDELWRPKVDRGDERPGTQAGQGQGRISLASARARRRVLFRLKGTVSCQISRPHRRDGSRRRYCRAARRRAPDLRRRGGAGLAL